MSSETDMGIYPENWVTFHPTETSPVKGNGSPARGFRILMQILNSPESSRRYDETCHVGDRGRPKKTHTLRGHGCMKQEDPPEVH